jgi:hypothetical protein
MLIFVLVPSELVVVADIVIALEFASAFPSTTELVVMFPTEKTSCASKRRLTFKPCDAWAAATATEETMSAQRGKHDIMCALKEAERDEGL